MVKNYYALFFRKVGVDLSDIPADAVTIDATDKLVMPGNLSIQTHAITIATTGILLIFIS